MRPRARAAAPSDKPDVCSILRDVRAGAAAASEASAQAKLKQSPLAEENAQLRREVAELRQQLMVALTASAAPSTELPAHGVAWLSAQVEQGRRQVQLLSEALTQRSEMSVELESVLLKLRQPAADGKRPEEAEWAAAAMRRLRHIQFAEEVSENLHELRESEAKKGVKARATGYVRNNAVGPSTSCSRRGQVKPGIAAKGRVTDFSGGVAGDGTASFPVS